MCTSLSSIANSSSDMVRWMCVKQCSSPWMMKPLLLSVGTVALIQPDGLSTYIVVYGARRTRVLGGKVCIGAPGPGKAPEVRGASSWSMRTATRWALPRCRCRAATPQRDAERVAIQTAAWWSCISTSTRSCFCSLSPWRTSSIATLWEGAP